ncbi:MAG: tetratricopeptide repeat protein [Gemmatimonadales bacterium]|nr:tetratricopeptide repeat protein [Gemmatimonadales bacterium]
MHLRSLPFVLVVLLLGVARPAHAQDPADLAWSRGDHATARQLYAARLAEDSSDVRALHRMALLYSWDGDYDRGLALFDRLMLVAPDNIEARIDRGRVFGWAGRFTESYQAYEETLARAPNSRGALLGLAQVLSWDDRLDSAQAIYGRLVAADSADLEARQGAARVAGWIGDLRAAEGQWHAALALDEQNTATRIGLSQVLRWQGRPDAAREVLDGIAPADHTSRDVVEERRWVEVATGPGVTPAVTYETDSDHNDILTIVLRGASTVRPRLRVGFDGYARTASGDPQVVPTRQAYGVMATGSYFIEPGWNVGAGLGLSTSNGAAASAEPSLRASVSSPVRNSYGGTLSFQRSAFDATALIMERGVTYTETALGLRGRPSRPWLLEGGVSYARFQGTDSNRRFGGYVAGTRRITAAWAAAARVRSFGFSEDRDDGYFDPNFYLHAEAFGRWQPLRGPWHVTAEAGPGLEQVTTDGNLHVTVRLMANAAYVVAPGRQIGLAALYTNAGLQSFASGAAGYRYFAMTLSGSWAF